jgi:hypothetical protein
MHLPPSAARDVRDVLIRNSGPDTAGCRTDVGYDQRVVAQHTANVGKSGLGCRPAPRRGETGRPTFDSRRDFDRHGRLPMTGRRNGQVGLVTSRMAALCRPETVIGEP